MTDLRECQCETPEPKVNKPHVCVRCGYTLSLNWTSNDATLKEFLDRLEESMPAAGEAFRQFRLHVEARELAGRPIFRQTFLSRPNLLRDIREEASDGALYACLDNLKQRRATGADEDSIDLLLTAAFHAYKMFEATLELEAKRHGAP